ncbi:glycosyltransferase family 61 protein [Kineococcus sp. G2]|uniref:glycosyltransferase family 61 protein n=1 Tax=Kineococcus sp. G2 TaxID=3127484 RepID=UPI00301C66A3
MRTGNTGWPYLLKRVAGHHVRDRVRERWERAGGRRVEHPSTTTAELAAEGAARRLVLHRATVAPLHRPADVPGAVWRQWRATHTGHVAEQVVLDLAGATVVSGFGWVFASGRLVADLWQEREHSAARMAAHVRPTGPAVHLTGTTASLLAPWVRNYYHWTVQGVPRVSMLAAAVDLSLVDHWLVPRLDRGYLGEWLDHLGVPREARVEVSGAESRVTTERLLVSSVPSAGYDVPRWVVRDVRERARSLRRADGPELLFVDRPDTGRRRLLNREEVLHAVRRRGFTVVDLDEAHLADEVALFSCARVVVGVHGAGLTNAVHCPPGSHLVEIAPGGLTYPTFHKLAAVAGLHHHVLRGTEPALPPPLAFLDNEADVIADLPALERLLDRLVPARTRVDRAGGAVL